MIIGTHKFTPLTIEACRAPFIDLPDTFGPKERRKIHSLCSQRDLYHSIRVGSGPTCKRRIVISIYADGFDYVPDLETSQNKRLARSAYQPWYYQTWDSANYISRKQVIESEKEQIRAFVRLPEKSLRTSDGTDQSFCDCLDFDKLNSLNLSTVPSPDQTPWMLVDSVDKLKLCVKELMYGVGSNANSKTLKPKIRELAFDLEMSNIFVDGSRRENKMQVRTCLIQLTSDVATHIEHGSEPSKEVFKDYIIDPLSPGLWDGIRVYLGPLFSDPSIVKIGHGIGGMDVSSLHHDFGILVVNAFDTYEASAILSARNGGMGLASLCRHYGLPSWQHYTQLKQKYQRSDWSKRPLDNDALSYGRYDVRFLVTLRKLLMRDLVKLDALSGEFVSGFKNDRGVDSEPAQTSKTGTPTVIADDSQLSSSPTFENECTATAANIENTNEEFVNKNNGKKMCVNYKIYASEFPCYNSLMQAISISQKRCLKLWTGHDDEEEVIIKNPSLLSLIKEASNQKGQLEHWTEASMGLYRSLCAWRRRCASREKMHASEVCSLEFLVHMALKMPKDRWEMRRHSYFLPVLLDDDSLPHCHELCAVITSSVAFQERVSSKMGKSMDVIFYSNKNADESTQERPKVLFKLLIASAAVGVFLLVATRARKK